MTVSILCPSTNFLENSHHLKIAGLHHKDTKDTQDNSGIPEFWDPQNSGIPQFWDPRILGSQNTGSPRILGSHKSAQLTSSLCEQFTSSLCEQLTSSLSTQFTSSHFGVTLGSLRGHFFEHFSTFSDFVRECSGGVQGSTKGVPVRF